MGTSLDNDELFALNQLFAHLYEDDNNKRALATFLEELNTIVEFQVGDIYFYKKGGEHINFEEFIVVGWNENYLDKYLNDYVDIDDTLPIISLKQPVMFRSSDVFIPHERVETKFYKDLLLPAGLEYSIEGNIYMGDSGYVAGIGIHRSGEIGNFTKKDLEIMKLARPHLENVAKKIIDKKIEQNAQSQSSRGAA